MTKILIWVEDRDSDGNITGHRKVIRDAQDGEIPTPPTAEELLTQRRARTSVTRADFLIAAKRAGLVNGQQAVAAAKGDTPQPFEAAIATMTDDEKDAARILWASLDRVDRMHPLILQVQSSMSLTDAQVDQLFGIF